MRSTFDTESGESGIGRAWRWFVPLVVLLIGFWFVSIAHTCRLGCFPGDLGDARFNTVILEHFHRLVTGQDASLLSPAFFYPMPDVLTFSDNHWGTAWLYSIFRFMGWDRYEAFDLWYLGGCLANFVVCHRVFRRLRFSPLASALGAFAFTFAMPVIATHGHAQLTFRALVPVGLLSWQRFRETGGWRWIGWLALAVVAQFYIAIYLGYFMLLFIAAWAAAQWFIERWGPSQWFRQWERWRQPADRAELVVAMLMVFVAFVALAWLMYPYLHYSKVYGFQRSPEELATMLPRPQSYLLADHSWIWGGLSARFVTAVPMRPEQQMFFGVGVLGLCVFAVIRSTLRLRWVALVSTLLLMLFTLSVGGHSLYLLVGKLPGLGSIRAISRIVVIMALPIALLVAIAVDALPRAARPSGLLVTALVALMFCESVATRTVGTEIGQARERISHLAESLPLPLPADAIVFNPLRPDVAFYDTELDGVILAQDMGRPTLNGYSGNIPPGYEPRVGEPACRQLWTRLQGATGFFATHLKRTLPAGASGPLAIIGQPSCPPDVWREIPSADLAKISLRIEALEALGASYRVGVVIHNGSSYALNTATGGGQPLRLSWQKLHGDGSVDPSAWVMRVDVGGGTDILPGEDREVSFTVPVVPGEQGKLAVSAVLEGRAWLHDHGMSPAVVSLKGNRP